MNTTRQSNPEDAGLVSLRHFVEATRDSGYQGLAEAVSELLDNSIQAGASQVDVTLALMPGHVKVTITDNGCGMDRQDLISALRFGGSSRFDDRRGLGRFGMGLPNASFSQARRVDVYSWTTEGLPLHVHLDLDDVVAGRQTTIPAPTVRRPPTDVPWRSGTVVIWSKCDRIKPGEGLLGALRFSLSRRFRHFLWNGVRISIDGEPLEGFDPLFLSGPRNAHARRVGKPLRIPVAIDTDHTSFVTVTFSELPIRRWAGLGNQEKQARGIANGAGVSVVRAGREISYGWHFLSDKRKENYDDWWRCEICFDPVLDEAFGVSHTKQQIRPTRALRNLLSPPLVSIARNLNGRVRKTFHQLRGPGLTPLHKRLKRSSQRLDPIPSQLRREDKLLLQHLRAKARAIRKHADVIVDSLPTMNFYAAARTGQGLVVALNVDHPFYKHIYKSFAASPSSKAGARDLLDLFLVALARADTAEGSATASAALNKHRQRWSNAMATYLLG